MYRFSTRVFFVIAVAVVSNTFGVSQLPAEGKNADRIKPYEKKRELIRTYQEAFVAKMLSYSLDYRHVLYCMDNETSTPAQWGQYWNLCGQHKWALRGGFAGSG